MDKYERAVYEALNLYYEFGYRIELRENVYNKYIEYVEHGGIQPMGYFFDTFDQWSLMGYCGY